MVMYVWVQDVVCISGGNGVQYSKIEGGEGADLSSNSALWFEEHSSLENDGHIRIYRVLTEKISREDRFPPNFLFH